MLALITVIFCITTALIEADTTQTFRSIKIPPIIIDPPIRLPINSFCPKRLPRILTCPLSNVLNVTCPSDDVEAQCTLESCANLTKTLDSPVAYTCCKSPCGGSVCQKPKVVVPACRSFLGNIACFVQGRVTCINDESCTGSSICCPGICGGSNCVPFENTVHVDCATTDCSKVSSCRTFSGTIVGPILREEVA